MRLKRRRGETMNNEWKVVCHVKCMSGGEGRLVSLCDLYGWTRNSNNPLLDHARRQVYIGEGDDENKDTEQVRIFSHLTIFIILSLYSTSSLKKIFLFISSSSQLNRHLFLVIWISMFFALTFLVTLLSVAQTRESSTSSLNVASTNTSCTVTYRGHVLTEGESTQIDGKIYKVEDCAVQRAFHACGTHLYHVIQLVCQLVDQRKHQTMKKSRTRRRRFSRRKTVTEACCLSVCTVPEMTRYCPWTKEVNDENSLSLTVMKCVTFERESLKNKRGNRSINSHNHPRSRSR